MITLIFTFLKSLRRRRLQKSLARYKASRGPRECVRLAWLLFKYGYGNQAIQVISDARRQHPKHGGIKRNYRRLKTLQVSRSLKRVSPLVTENASLRMLSKACDLACALGNYDQAAHYAAEATRLHPDNWQSHFVLGKLYFHRFNSTRDEYDQEQALTHLGQAYQLNPENCEVLFLLAFTLARLDEYETAREILHYLLDLRPHDSKGIQLLDFIEINLRQQTRSGPASAAAVANADINIVVERISEIEGNVGIFAFNEGGALLGRSEGKNSTFIFPESDDAIRSMLTTCHNDVSRIGIGEFRSCLLCGEGWQAIVRSFNDFEIVAFFENYPHGEELEHEIDEVVQESALA